MRYTGYGDYWTNGLTSDNIAHEPNAASPIERIFSLNSAQTAGIKTWVSVEPVIDPKEIRFIIEHDNIDLFRIGKLNGEKSDIDWGEFGREAERLCMELGRNYYIKDDLRKEMEK